MSLRIDTSEWIADALVIGDAGLGVLGSDIPSTGDDGASILFNDIEPGDEASEFRALILSTPPGGSIFFFEDGSFEAADYPDGVHGGTYEGFKDGVSYGTASYSFQIGATAVEVAPGVGAITITGYAPTVEQSNARNLEPAAGAISVTGYAPTITQPISVAPGAGSLTITGYAPTVTQASADRTVSPLAGTLTITGYAPTVTRSGVVTKQYPLAGLRQTFPLTGQRQF